MPLRKYSPELIDPKARRSAMLHMMEVKYGMTEKDYDDMLFEQDGMCGNKGCGEDIAVPSDDGRTRVCIDHDSITEEVRGLLCYSCNVLLGKIYHDPGAAAKRASQLGGLSDYIIKHENMPVEQKRFSGIIGRRAKKSEAEKVKDAQEDVELCGKLRELRIAERPQPGLKMEYEVASYMNETGVTLEDAELVAKSLELPVALVKTVMLKLESKRIVG